MAMSGTEMGGLIFNELRALLSSSFTTGSFDYSLMRNFCNAIGNGVVTHIKGSAEVNGGVCKDGGAIKGGKVE